MNGDDELRWLQSDANFPIKGLRVAPPPPHSPSPQLSLFPQPCFLILNFGISETVLGKSSGPEYLSKPQIMYSKVFLQMKRGSVDEKRLRENFSCLALNNFAGHLSIRDQVLIEEPISFF